jgi:hypothetical protein
MGICSSAPSDEDIENSGSESNNSGKYQNKRGSLKYPPGLAPKEYVSLLHSRFHDKQTNKQTNIQQ